MLDYLSDRAVGGATLVVASGMAARQLEPGLARRQIARGHAAWLGASPWPLDTWVRDVWTRYVDDGTRQPLSRSQARALWQQIIANSPRGEDLIGSRSASHWALDASQRLRAWGVDPTDLRANDDDVDFKSFLSWEAEYRAALTDARWLDPMDPQTAIADELENPGGSASGVIWVDFADPTPTQLRMYERFRSAGWALERWVPQAHEPRHRRVCLPSAAEELRSAAHWAGEKLARDPRIRIALVIPGLATRRHEVASTLEDALAPRGGVFGAPADFDYMDLGGAPARCEPLIGAALTALELFAGRGDFSAVSRWLRSPFLEQDPGERSARARLEARLRTTLSAQLPFVEAYRAPGFVDALQQEAPELARGMAAAMHLWRTAEDHATPTVWTQLWQSMLNRLGWPGSERQLDSAAVTAWERALTELSGLTPIVGSISARRALQELEHVLGRPQTPGPTGMRGISLLGQLEDLGVGYDAVWVSGLTDSHWPCAARPNPLLPLALQSAHGMPLATPRQALDHCRQTTGRLLARAPELVLSWPARVQECPAHASPLILGVPEADAETLLVPASAGRRRQLLNSRARRMDSDSAPPLTRREISGGANTLRLQSLCPLRAFVETRLGARPMEPATRGLSRLQRGIVAHRTMELLLRQLPRQIELSEWPPAARASSIGNCVDTALHETLGPVLRPLKWLFDLERARLIALAQGLVTLDLKRGQFEVAAVEEPHVVELGGRRVRCRIDRVDVLTGEDGRQGLAVIDYKTGAGAGPADWFRGRLRDTQIPLYATALGAEVVAAVVGLLKYDDIRYRGLWAQPGQFPGRMMPLPDRRPWRSQIAVWREQLETLVGEYARGDTRILLADAEQARGALAPLTRAYEQEALARGWVRGSGPA